MIKLKALFIGNCQNGGLRDFLSYSKEFCSTFETKWYANWQLIESQSCIPMKDVQEADLFVYQPLRPEHGCYSTDPTIEGSIGYYVNDNCIKLTHPYVFSSSFWPIVQAGQGKNSNRWFGGEQIDKLLNMGIGKNEILNLFYTNQIDWEYGKRFEQSIQILQNKESITDIKISEFIVNNFKNQLLFLIPQHPTSAIFLNMTNQILEKLNMKKMDDTIIKTVNDLEIEDSTYNSKSKMFPLHESVINNFGLNFGKEYLEGSGNFYEQRLLTYLQNYQ
jgi:hypothetical protein